MADWEIRHCAARLNGEHTLPVQLRYLYLPGRKGTGVTGSPDQAAAPEPAQLNVMHAMVRVDGDDHDLLPYLDDSTLRNLEAAAWENSNAR